MRRSRKALAPLAALAALLSACAAPCNTADLDARYAADLAWRCLGPDGRPLPLEHCKSHPALAAEYERAVADRIEQCHQQ